MHSLISPADKEKIGQPSRPLRVESLNMSEVEEAFDVLNKDIRFAQVDRYYADPPQPQQNIALVSFVPSKGAVPDKDNIYGMMKVRGVYATEEEANERAEYLIRHVDSYHDIFHAHVGRPFPVTTATVFASSLKNIDIRQKTTELISQDILDKKRKEQKEMEDMKTREKDLLDESKRAQNNEGPDPFDDYITQNVKRAQLAWTYHETIKKLDQMRSGYRSAIVRIQELDQQFPDFVDRYKDKYMEARRASGIKDDPDSFIQYLGLDLSVDIENANEHI